MRQRMVILHEMVSLRIRARQISRANGNRRLAWRGDLYGVVRRLLMYSLAGVLLKEDAVEVATMHILNGLARSLAVDNLRLWRLFLRRDCSIWVHKFTCELFLAEAQLVVPRGLNTLVILASQGILDRQHDFALSLAISCVIKRTEVKGDLGSADEFDGGDCKAGLGW